MKQIRIWARSSRFSWIVQRKTVSTRLAVVLCNGGGSSDEDFGISGIQAVAALLGGGEDIMAPSICSSLSVIACPLGNKGAMAIAKALCGQTLEEVCLESCDIGNAGAVVLALALGKNPPRKIDTTGSVVVLDYPNVHWQCLHLA